MGRELSGIDPRKMSAHRIFRDQSLKILWDSYFQGSIPENPLSRGLSGIDPRKCLGPGIFRDRSLKVPDSIDFQGSIPENPWPALAQVIFRDRSLKIPWARDFQGSVPENIIVSGLFRSFFQGFSLGFLLVVGVHVRAASATKGTFS